MVLLRRFLHVVLRCVVLAGLGVLEWYVAESSCCYALWPVRSSILQGDVHRVVQTLCPVHGPLAHGPLASALCRCVLLLALSFGMDAVSSSPNCLLSPGVMWFSGCRLPCALPVARAVPSIPASRVSRSLLLLPGVVRNVLPVYTQWSAVLRASCPAVCWRPPSCPLCRLSWLSPGPAFHPSANIFAGCCPRCYSSLGPRPSRLVIGLSDRRACEAYS